MNLPEILLWGFVATLLLTTIMTPAHGLGLSRISIPYMLGTLFTPDHDRALVIGFLLHLRAAGSLPCSTPWSSRPCAAPAGC